MLNMYPTKTCINNSNTDHYSEFKTKVEKDAKAYYLIRNFSGCQRYPRELMPSVRSWFHSQIALLMQVHIRQLDQQTWMAGEKNWSSHQQRHLKLVHSLQEDEHQEPLHPVFSKY